MKTRTNKYTYYKIIQQYYATKWEDASNYETDSTYCMNKENRELLKHDVKEYRIMGYPTRVIKRKELN